MGVGGGWRGEWWLAKLMGDPPREDVADDELLGAQEESGEEFETGESLLASSAAGAVECVTTECGNAAWNVTQSFFAASATNCCNWFRR